MTGIELEVDILTVDREPNVLDELVIQFSAIIADLDIAHVFVSGWVAILTGRSRATEDIDVLRERVDTETVDTLVDRLDAAGLWGRAMPLDRMAELLDDHIWVAVDGEMVPHLEVKFVDDRFDRASLNGRITSRIADAELPVGPLELQIAYKLWMGTQTDFEDALHRYSLFEESRRTAELERWVDELGVVEAYARLRRT